MSRDFEPFYSHPGKQKLHESGLLEVHGALVADMLHVGGVPFVPYVQNAGTWIVSQNRKRSRVQRAVLKEMYGAQWRYGTWWIRAHLYEAIDFTALRMGRAAASAGLKTPYRQRDATRAALEAHKHGEGYAAALKGAFEIGSDEAVAAMLRPGDVDVVTCVELIV